MSVPRVFGLPHLSEDAVAAFADGVLSTAAAARAQRHCAECRECADAVRGQREAAMMLRSAASPCLPSGLLDRLAGLPMSAPLPPPSHGLPTVLGSDGVPVFDTRTDRGTGPQGGPTAGTVQDENDGPARSTGQAMRRGSLPFGLLASAAAVVAAGTLGGHQVAAAPARSSLVPASSAGSAQQFGGTSLRDTAFAGISTASVRTVTQARPGSGAGAAGATTRP